MEEQSRARISLVPDHRLNNLSCFDSGSLSRYLVSKLIHAVVKGNRRCEGRAKVILQGSSRVKARVAQHLGKDVALGPSRVGRAAPAIASIRWLEQAALPLSGYAEDPILGRASCTKKPGAEERMFPDHRYCLSNFLIAYNLRGEVSRGCSWHRQIQCHLLKAATLILRFNKGGYRSRPIGSRSTPSYYSNCGRCNTGHIPSHR